MTLTRGVGTARAAADRYLDAARHMRPRQLLARPRRFMPARLLAAGRDGRPAIWEPAAAGLGVDPAPQSGPQPPAQLDGRFRAVGCERAFPSEGFWTNASDGLLFLFHLHGFGELARYCAGAPTPAGDAFWVSVLGSWLDAHARPSRPAWHPFPTSGRIIAWSAALSRGGWSPELSAAMQVNLVRQLRLLRRSVEHDIGGNHVLRNGAALAIGGLCASDRQAEAAGLSLLEGELASQLLSDGGHEERSTAYHRAVLADLDDVAAALRKAGRPIPEWLDTATGRMRRWLRALAGPDGRLPLLNDAWEGPPVEDPLTDATVDLVGSGYVVLRAGGDQVVLDVGRVAPPHLPPHAHADVLSFVLWADGAPIVVDPGSFAYAGPERLRFRGTAAHNTVEVDGRDQCDLWGAFRAAHMPRVRRGTLTMVQDAAVLTAEHDGYARLPDPVLHRRTFCWLPGDGLVVIDRLLAREIHDVRTRIHLAPGVMTDGARAGPLEVRPLGDGPAPEVERGAYAPFLGRKVATRVLHRQLACRPQSAFGWALVRTSVAVTLDDGRVRVERPGREVVEFRPG